MIWFDSDIALNLITKARSQYSVHVLLILGLFYIKFAYYRMQMMKRCQKSHGHLKFQLNQNRTYVTYNLKPHFQKLLKYCWKDIKQQSFNLPLSVLGKLFSKFSPCLYLQCLDNHSAVLNASEHIGQLYTSIMVKKYTYLKSVNYISRYIRSYTKKCLRNINAPLVQI